MEINKFKRYNPCIYLGSEDMEESDTGEYVRWADVEGHIVHENPCPFFTRDKIVVGQNARNENHVMHVPWCNHAPSQESKR
jgi:hypothetical protein